MKKIAIIPFVTFLSVLIGISSCSMDESPVSVNNPVMVNGREVPSEGYMQDIVHVKFSEEIADNLELATTEEGVITTNIPAVKSAIEEINVLQMRRTFPYDEEYEERHRKYGLHLWYEIRFDKEVSLVKASEVLSEIEGVVKIDYAPKMIRPQATLVEDDYSHLGPVMVSYNETEPIFDDPDLEKQWHYHNDGSTKGAKAGSDINVLPVWEKGIVGSEEVVVAVFDGGVDFIHEDLAENMWVDPTNGTHGRNFMEQVVGGQWSTSIEPDDHGTHVAGVIAAVNNNGIGMSGVAGGDKKTGVKGARIMTCQIFNSESGYADYAAGLVWAADNGAVISQNSWGYDEDTKETPDYVDVAINYFIDNAGVDKSGNQIGPMAGGIVIFAAGNESRDYCVPPMHDKVIAVTAIGNDFAPASYTNFGDWTDILAPGGDGKNGNSGFVYSTVTNNKYAGMQGTSMACPHVSGVAALVISQYGGPGFTAEHLKNLLLTTTRDITQYTGTAVHYGVGLVDATQAMSMGSTIAPDPITDLSMTSRSNIIDYSFTVPADEDDKKPTNVRLYYSKNEFDPSVSLEGVDSVTATLRSVVAGETFKGTIKGLEFYTKYYVYAVAIDFAGNRSDFSNMASVETLGNTNPEIEAEGETTVEMKGYETKTLKFFISDPDEHAVTASLKESYPGLRLTQGSAGSVSVTISGDGLASGEYHAFLVATDAYGATTELEIVYVILANSTPEVIGQIENMVFNSTTAKAQTVELDQYFIDHDGESLKYTIVGEDGNEIKTVIKTPTVSGQQLKIAPKSVGMVVVKVIARDNQDASAEISFNVLVRGSDAELEFYPNPVVDFLNVRPSKDLKDVNVEVVSASGSVVHSAQNEEAVTPFAPFAVDFKSLPAGQYTVKATYTTAEGKTGEIQKSVAKL